MKVSLCLRIKLRAALKETSTFNVHKIIMILIISTKCLWSLLNVAAKSLYPKQNSCKFLCFTDDLVNFVDVAESLSHNIIWALTHLLQHYMKWKNLWDFPETAAGVWTIIETLVPQISELNALISILKSEYRYFDTSILSGHFCH